MEKPNILICDDEEGVRESLKMLLAGNYNLSYAVNGEQAMESLKGQSPDLVILDIKMPGMNGLEALRRIKKEKPGVPVMMVTGYESIEVATEAVGLGADDYLTKPFDRRKILGQIQALLKPENA